MQARKRQRCFARQPQPERLPATSGDLHGRSKSRLASVPLRSWMSCISACERPAICPDPGREIGASERPGARLMGVGGSEWSENPYRLPLAGRVVVGETFTACAFPAPVLTFRSWLCCCCMGKNPGAYALEGCGSDSRREYESRREGSDDMYRLFGSGENGEKFSWARCASAREPKLFIDIEDEVSSWC